jgi:OOP family OmpA-OmpF porin
MKEGEETSRRILMLAGAVGALVAMVLGLLAPHGGAVWRVPQVLEQRTAAALSAGGYGGLDIEMRGQRVMLTGFVEDEADIEAARRVALTSAGAGGAWAGGVTSVDVSGVQVGPFERPYAWSARRDGERVVLNGPVPSEAARADLMAAAAEALPNAEAIDEMRVAGGAASPYFTDMARNAVRQLASLREGEARIVDDQIVFIGDANEAGADALRRAFTDPPAPFRTRLEVTVDGLDVAHPELQGLNLVGSDAETCERAFGRLMERNVINFAAGSAAIDPSSRQILNALASVAFRCDRFSIEVAGHTDNVGAREMNMELSQRRADAVASYLAAQGVARSRLISRGYGPDQPRMSNTTSEGQAANRRIEFYVSS